MSLTLSPVQDQGITHGCNDLKFRPRSYPARPSLQIAPDLGHSDQVVRVKAREQRRVLGQLREGPEDLRLNLRQECRPAAPPWGWRRRQKRLPFGSKALHLLYLPHLPHTWGDPSRAGLPATGETVDLAGRLLGPHVIKPPLPPGAHGRQRPSLAVIGEGPCAAPAMETTALFTRYRPLTAEAVTVAYASTAALLVFAVRAGFRHLPRFELIQWWGL
jgi:hypothetical protein